MASNSNKLVHVIVNPISGGRPPDGRLTPVVTAMASAGYEVRRQTTEGPGHATALAAAAEPDARAVLVYGGDGTIREAATGLAGRALPLYHLAGGNENLFAGHFGMRRKPAAVLAALEANKTRAVDLLDVNGLTAASFVGVGFDAQVVKVVTQLRRGHVSHLSYVGPIWRTFWSYRFPTLEVVADGKTIFQGQGMVFGGNITRYAAGIPLFKRAVDDDGLLDIVVFPCRTRWSLVKSLLATVAGWHHKHRRIIYTRAARVKIIGATGVPTQIDGDVGPDTPVEATIMPKALTVLTPAD